MAAPINLKSGKRVMATSEVCPRCPHLLSAHDDSPLRCTAIMAGGRCSCIPQDVHGDSRASGN